MNPDFSSAPRRETPTPGPPTVALCVSGSVAAYKAVELARLLRKDGVAVLPVMTASAARFVGPVTLAAICSEGVLQDMWDPSFAGEMHIHVTQRADAIAVVPATADVLARLAQGRANDLVTAIALCARGPVLVAPAMHPRMWAHPATQRNVAELVAQNKITFVGPVNGEVASGEVGLGRMAEPDAIAAVLKSLLSPRDLAGLRLVVTAGPTLEDFDPVRFLGNRSSGKMGFAVAAQAAMRGAVVTLVSGPVSLPTPPFVRRVDVRGAASMQAALGEALGTDLSRADALVMAAAVADYRPSETSDNKIKKSDPRVSIQFDKNPDILAEIGSARRGKRPLLVGFAVETVSEDALVLRARRKVVEKRVDFIVANEAKDSFGRDDNRATLVDATFAQRLPEQSKTALADAVLDRVRDTLKGDGGWT